MTKLTDALNRLILFLLGSLILACGALCVALYFDVTVAQQLIDALHPHEWDTVPNSPWFLFTVGTCGVLALLFGVAGLIANLRTHRVHRVVSSASTLQGEVSFDISDVADAAAHSFLDIPKVIRSRGIVFVDHGRRIMRISVDLESSVQLPMVSDHASVVEEYIRSAIGDTDVEILFTFQVAPVERLS